MNTEPRPLLEETIEKLRQAHEVVSAKDLPGHDSDYFWRNQYINRIYRKFTKQHRRCLVLTGPAREVAERLRTEIFPISSALQDDFHHDRTRGIVGANNSVGHNLLEYAITCMFTEPIVSRWGLPADERVYSLVARILPASDNVTRDSVSALLQSLFPEDNSGWSHLRTYLWSFGCYDAHRILADAEEAPNLRAPQIPANHFTPNP